MAGSPCWPRDSQESSSTPQLKSNSSVVLSFVYSLTLTSIHNYWKNFSLGKAFLNDWLYRKVALQGLWEKLHTLGPSQEEKGMTEDEMVGW